MSLARGVLVLLLAALLGSCAATPVVVKAPPADEKGERDRETLSQLRLLARGGDWLVSRGYHATDNFVATATNMPFSHAAVVDAERGTVIEAEAQGVHITPLADFVAKSHRVLLVRPVWSREDSAQAAIARARSLVGRPYDLPGLVGINVPDSYYCSELAVEIYRPWIRRQDVVPRPVGPGQLPYWGRVLYDSGAL